MLVIDAEQWQPESGFHSLNGEDWRKRKWFNENTNQQTELSMSDSKCESVMLSKYAIPCPKSIAISSFTFRGDKLIFHWCLINSSGYNQVLWTWLLKMPPFRWMLSSQKLRNALMNKAETFSQTTTATRRKIISISRRSQHLSTECINKCTNSIAEYGWRNWIDSAKWIINQNWHKNIRSRPPAMTLIIQLLMTFISFLMNALKMMILTKIIKSKITYRKGYRK